MPSPNSNISVDTNPDGYTVIDDDIIRYVESGYSESYDFNYTDEQIPNLITNMINGIFGIPYQFSQMVDLPIEGTDFGRMYMEKVIGDMPVLFLSPGEPLFMAGYNTKTIQSMVNSFMDNPDEVDIDDIIGETEGRYYQFESKLEDCAKYINTAACALAKFKGIEDEVIPTPTGGSIRMREFNILRLLNPDFSRHFGAQTSIPFYLDSETQISENFSNDTTESMLSQKANSLSDTAREIQFLLGTHSVLESPLYKAMQNAVGSTIGGTTNIIESLPVGKNVLGALTSELTTVVSGGRMVFPEIWSGSSYSRNYSINLKLRSPDPDPLSIFLNVDLPIIILVAMASGRQFGASANSYGSPYLVRASYKSVFACDLGIISSLDITRGGEGRWNGAGMATSADVSISIKDLYSTMFISHTVGGLLNNTSELDWLALMAGMDMNQNDYTRRLNLAAYLVENKIRNIPETVWSKFKGGMNKAANNFLSKLGADMRYVR